MAEGSEPESRRGVLQAALSSLGGISPFTAAMAARFIEKESSNMPHILAWLARAGCKAPEPALAAPLTVCTSSGAWQRGCPEVIPGLRAEPFWRTPCSRRCAGLPASPQLAASISALEEACADIKMELMALRGRSIFQQYHAPTWAGRSPSMASPSPQIGRVGTDSGSWNVAYLQLHDAVSCDDIQALCPRTMAALSRIPRLYDHSLFSSLAPGSHIATHCGPTNRKLRLHLPLVVPEDVGGEPSGEASGCCCVGDEMLLPVPDRPARTAASRPACWLRAGPRRVQWREGKVLVFDDSFQHEAANYASSARIVLIVDVWHPDLTDPEVKLLELIRKSQLRAAKAMGSSDGVSSDDDFFRVLQAARAVGADDAVVFPAGAAGSSIVSGGCGAGAASGSGEAGSPAITVAADCARCDLDSPAVFGSDAPMPLSTVPVVND